MGYVFDALNRSKKDGSDKSAPPSTPETPAPESRPADQAQGLSLQGTPALSDVPPPSGGANVTTNTINQKVELRHEHIDDRLVASLDPGSVMAEEYRGIRTGLMANWEQERHLVYTITSATPQEGKTITSLNLGISFAELHNRRTIVLEADLRLPQFQKLLGLDDPPGVIALLEGKATLAEVTTSLSNGLDVICAGGRADNRSMQLLSGTRMADLVQTLRHKYDHVIIDTPPVVELADAGILGAMSDGVLLIARMNRTPRPLIEQAVRTLASYKAPVAGILATDHPRNRKAYYYHRYGYRYKYSYYKNAA